MVKTLKTCITRVHQNGNYAAHHIRPSSIICTSAVSQICQLLRDGPFGIQGGGSGIFLKK